MFDLYYWTTPNGHKITLFLEEASLPYRLIPVRIGKGEQFAPGFLKVSPNNKIPAIVDHSPADGGEPLALFESGAILLYLADKIGRFIPQYLRGRQQAIQWLFWQMGGLGPMAGQNHHFTQYAPEPIPYAIERYVKETSRLYAVLDRHLDERDFIAGAGAGEYGIADMACYPWIVPHDKQGQSLDDYPNIKRWFEAIYARPGTQRAYAQAAQFAPDIPAMTEESRRILFDQDAATVRREDSSA